MILADRRKPFNLIYFEQAGALALIRRAVQCKLYILNEFNSTKLDTVRQLPSIVGERAGNVEMPFGRAIYVFDEDVH